MKDGLPDALRGSSLRGAEFRSGNPLADAAAAARVKLPDDLLLRAQSWVRAGSRSAPNLIVPGVHAGSSAYFNCMEELMDFYAKQHAEHPQLVPTDGTQYVSLPGIHPDPAGIIPPDSRPLLKQKFLAHDLPPGHQHWATLERRAELPGLAASRATFADRAQYPSWFVQHLDVCAAAIWPAIRPAGVVIKAASQMGLLELSKDVDVKQSKINNWVANGGHILRLLSGGKHAECASLFHVALCYTSGSRLQEEGTRDPVTKKAVPKKKRPLLTWRGDIMDMGRVLRSVPDGWDKRIPEMRLAVRERQLAQGTLGGDFAARCLVRPMIEGRLAAWPSVFLVRALGELDEFLQGATYVQAYDIGNNDQSQGREVVRAVCRRVDVLHGGGGWYVDQLLRAPLLAKADIRKDRGKGWLSSNPFDPHGFVSHYLVSSGNPFTGEITQLHGTVTIATALWLYERDVLGHRVAFDAAYVNRLLARELPVRVRITGDNLLIVSDDARYEAFVRDATRWSLFALLEKSETYAGYVIVQDTAARTARAYYNIDSMIRRTLAHDRGLDSPLRGDPSVGWEARKLRFMGHPLGLTWQAALLGITEKHFGSPLDVLYREASAQRPTKIPRVFNLSEVEAEYVEDPSVVEWKYPLASVRKELLDLAFISVPPRVVQAVLNHVRSIGHLEYGVELPAEVRNLV